jgi:hypothetical protein
MKLAKRTKTKPRRIEARSDYAADAGTQIVRVLGYGLVIGRTPTNCKKWLSRASPTQAGRPPGLPDCPGLKPPLPVGLRFMFRYFTSAAPTTYTARMLSSRI